MSLNLDDIKAAAEIVSGVCVRTPTLPSQTLSDITGANIFLKFENLQFTGSFKDRGALVKMSRLDPEAARAGVIAMSAGNHAQGVAYHARNLGLPATIVMPRFTPFNKVRHTQGFGARVVLEGETLEESKAHADLLAEKDGLTFIHPYDDDDIIAGQGTAALEMLEDYPEIDTLVIPIGGGGLISGCSIAAKGLNPDMRIVGAEAALYPSMQRALAGGEQVIGGQTIADGIAVKAVGQRAIDIAREHVSEILSVSEAQIEEAIVLYMEIEKTVAEGAGATALAALIAHPELFSGRNCGVIISGGNIDSRLLASVISRGLVRQGRIVSLRVEISDQPGALAQIASLVGEAGANIIEVAHHRLFSDVPVKGADLDLMIETRDPEHGREVVARITAAGYAVTQMSITAAGGAS
jgi:threonine dehydratase